MSDSGREFMPDGTPVATIAEITAELRLVGVDPDDAEDHECEEAARRVADRIRTEGTQRDGSEAAR